MVNDALLLIVVNSCSDDYESWHQIIGEVRSAGMWLDDHGVPHGDLEVAGAIQEAVGRGYIAANAHNHSLKGWEEVPTEVVKPVPEGVYSGVRWYLITQRGRAFVDGSPESFWDELPDL